MHAQHTDARNCSTVSDPSTGGLPHDIVRCLHTTSAASSSTLRPCHACCQDNEANQPHSLALLCSHSSDLTRQYLRNGKLCAVRTQGEEQARPVCIHRCEARSILSGLLSGASQQCSHIVPGGCVPIV